MTDKATVTERWSGAERMDWTLAELEKEAFDATAIMHALDGMASEGAETESRDLCDMLVEALITRGQRPALIEALTLRTALSASQPGWDKRCRALLERVFGDRMGKAFLGSIGLDAPHIALTESLRRLAVLMALGEGIYCLDKTWGFGVVKRLDDFYLKVTIDFSRKASHQMTFAYAAETLTIIGKDHLLARRHDDAGALRNMAAGSPEELTKVALRSYGAMNATSLQELLAREQIVPETEWKAFWDRARKGLKADPLVDLPAKRSEPIRLLTREKHYGESWMADFQLERDARRIYELTEELRAASDVAALSDASRCMLADRLNFGILGAESASDVALATRLFLLAQTCGFTLDVPVSTLDMGRIADDFLGSNRLFKACVELSPSDVGRLLNLLEGRNAPALTAYLLARLYTFPSHVIEQAMRYLLEHADPAVLKDDIADHFRQEISGGAVLAWHALHLNQVQAWGFTTLMGLFHAILRELELPADLERRRNQKILRALFDDKNWVEDVLHRLDPSSRETLMIRVRESRGWDESARRSVMARMIKIMPELGEVAASEKRVRSEKKELRWTSWRSYSERQEQLRLILEVAIPENSKDIGVARSYGDLRENFEYQAAKDQQRLLMARRAELERDLGDVRGTDFKTLPAEVAGIGTGIEIERPGGSIERYWILGEWDRDEALGIISNRSELAKALEGLPAGQSAALPGDEPGTVSQLRRVFPLDDVVRGWIEARPAVAL